MLVPLFGNPNSPSYATIAAVGSLASPDGHEAAAVALADEVIASKQHRADDAAVPGGRVG